MNFITNFKFMLISITILLIGGSLFAASYIGTWSYVMGNNEYVYILTDNKFEVLVKNNGIIVAGERGELSSTTTEIIFTSTSIANSDTNGKLIWSEIINPYSISQFWIFDGNTLTLSCDFNNDGEISGFEIRDFSMVP